MNNITQNTPYINLARKYRPQTILELIGQTALVVSLENAFNLNKIAHAFMLTGTRGVGKTTTARIIAKALNCIGEDGKGQITLTPCGVCDNCQLIMQDRHLDVIEIDAASKTGVDDIREIIEHSQYKPSVARYKIFIIDEVHMLSKNAFNALLKTLEEPPLHLKFIFATTEIKKVPITVLSRCQRYDLKMIDVKELSTHLTKICNLEKVNFEDEAINLLAKAAQGSVRDSLSLLDRAIIYSNSNITVTLTLEMLGMNNYEMLYNLYLAIITGNATKAFSIFNMQKQAGIAPEIFLEEMLNICHNAMVLDFVKDSSMLNLSTNELQQLQQIVEATNYTVLLQIWQILIQSTTEIKQAFSQYNVCSMALIKLLSLHNLANIDDLINLTNSTANITNNSANKNESDKANTEDVLHNYFTDLKKT